MTDEYLSNLQLFYDLFSVELVERKIECLDTASIVSRQLLNAGIKHRVVCGTARLSLKYSDLALLPHYYVEADIANCLIIFDPSLAFWLEDEIADGLVMPFVFRGYQDAESFGIHYSPYEPVDLGKMVCSDLAELADQHSLPFS